MSATDREANVRFGYSFGWSFTPLNGKTPILPGWQKAPRETLEQALTWAAAGNVGLRTGTARTGLVIVDVDPGGDAAPLNLPPTVKVRTGRGGAHYYFRCAQPVGNSNSTKTPLHNNVTNLPHACSATVAILAVCQQPKSSNGFGRSSCPWSRT